MPAHTIDNVGTATKFGNIAAMQRLQSLELLLQLCMFVAFLLFRLLFSSLLLSVFFVALFRFVLYSVCPLHSRLHNGKAAKNKLELEGENGGCWSRRTSMRRKAKW